MIMNEDKKNHGEGKPADGHLKAGFAKPGMMAPGAGGHGAGQPGMMNRPMNIGKMTAQQFKPAAPKLKPGETVNAVRKTFPVMGMSCASCARECAQPSGGGPGRFREFCGFNRAG
jgi:hypothetical protein